MTQLSRKSKKRKKKKDITQLYNLAVENANSGNFSDATKYAQQCLAINDHNDMFYNLMGVILQQSGQDNEAIKYFEKAIKINSQVFNYFYALGISLKNVGRIEESLKQQTKALAIEPDHLWCLNEIGLLYIMLDDKINAEKYLFRALELDPNDITTLINVAYHCAMAKLLNEAISHSEKVIKQDPSRSEPYYVIGQCLLKANFYEKGIEYINISLQKSDQNKATKHQELLMYLLYTDLYDYETVFEAHKNWAQNFLTYQPLTLSNKKDPFKRLKIGFISSDLKEHSVSYFLLPIFRNYAKDKFEYTCFSGVQNPDKMSDKIKSLVDSWVNIHGLADTEIISAIQKHEIDILIDLAGQSNNNFIQIFSSKAAPVQMTYLGYPFTTGLENMDYRLSDNYADPIGLTEKFHTEKLIRFPASFLCYEPTNADIPHNRTPPIEKNKFVTFGSFNNLNKMSESTISLWSRILNGVDSSVLVLKSSADLPGLLKEHIIAQFQSHGISLDRLIFNEYIKNRINHLEKYNDIDICLDTFPYNGTTTTYESLWMGVPVITLCGNGHPSRVGNSILHNMDLADLVATAADDYVNIAVTLANNPEKIKEYRQSLREKLLHSPLTDSASFIKEFEKTLVNAWQTYCKNSD